MADEFRDRELFDPIESDDFAWEPVDGYPDGVEKLVLYADPDGRSSYLVRFPPGIEMDTGVITHDFYEECWILDGSLVDSGLGETFHAGMYTSRTPGMEHGPYETRDESCVIFVHEFRK